jgi:phage terminase large subunit-like protein
MALSQDARLTSIQAVFIGLLYSSLLAAVSWLLAIILSPGQWTDHSVCLQGMGTHLPVRCPLWLLQQSQHQPLSLTLSSTNYVWWQVAQPHPIYSNDFPSVASIIFLILNMPNLSWSTLVHCHLMSRLPCQLASFWWLLVSMLGYIPFLSFVFLFGLFSFLGFLGLFGPLPLSFSFFLWTFLFLFWMIASSFVSHNSIPSQVLP